VFFKCLPWEYGIRNLFRRPVRSGLTLVALSTVILLVFVVVGFIRGLERSLDVSGDPNTVIVFSQGMGENLEYSSISRQAAGLVIASFDGIEERYGKKYASPELYLGTQVRLTRDGAPGMGLIRGVIPAALLVHSDVEIIEGDWPKPGELLVGRLAATKMGVAKEAVRPGETVWFEGRAWKISGVFTAKGSVYESESWCRLDDLQQALKRDDLSLSLVALRMGPGMEFEDIAEFCKIRTNLKLSAIRQVDYFNTLQEDYAPVRMLAWVVVVLISGAGVFAGLNMMYGSVVGRVRELATLQTIGFLRRSIVLSLVQEGTVLSVTASLLASVVAFGVINESAVRFTMGAFQLRVDSVALLIGYGVGLILGIVGSLPPALRVLRLPVIDGLKSI
jgi:ABC-type lipoprotein release transport system permease subunit